MAAKEEDKGELPDEVLCHILSFLPVADAFSLKLLSRRWSRLHVPLSNLYFNQENIFGRKYDSSDVLLKLKSEFVEKVDWFLKLFRGPYLNTFMVDFCMDNESAPVIDSWVSFAVSMEAESIELDFNTSKSQNLYKFPFRLLPKPKPFARLKHLKLSACHLLLSPQSSFNCLKTLELKNLALDQTSLDAVISSCFDLEWLTLDECELPRTLRVCNARLRGLRFLYCWETHTIELDAAQLQAFEFRGRWLELSFLVVPPLERVHFGSQYMEFDLLSITSVLNACPMLQKLHLAMSLHSVCSESGKKEKVVYSKNMKYLHSEEIEFSGFGGSPDQMELVIYLLNNAVSLKHMTLIHSRWKSHDYKWRNVERRSWSKLLSEKEFLDSLRKEMISHGAELVIC
ncbi:hypothetical protein ACLB2K_057551 [Fragaria x ananassa]